MKNFLDKLQQAWQSQCSKPLDVKPDQLLKVARYERLVQFCVDIGMISFFFCVGILMLGWAFRDIQKDWPWLISVCERRMGGGVHPVQSLAPATSCCPL